MSRTLTFSAALIALSATGLASAALASDATTTRIEPRAYYGAVVTIEHGVHVYRPVPPTTHMIINPGGQTPLNLSEQNVKVQETSTSQNYYYGGTPVVPGASVSPGYYYDGRIGGGHHGHHHDR